MKNKTTYTYERLMKLNLFAVKKQKLRVAIIAIVMLVLGVGFILSTYFTNGIIEPFLTFFGLAFLALAYLNFITLIKSNKKALAQSVDKQMHDNSSKYVEYQFEDEYINFEIHSEQEECNAKIKYSYIAQVAKIDDKSCYFLTKNNRYYLIYDKQGVDDYYSYISERI